MVGQEWPDRLGHFRRDWGTGIVVEVNISHSRQQSPAEQNSQGPTREKGNWGFLNLRAEAAGFAMREEVRSRFVKSVSGVADAQILEFDFDDSSNTRPLTCQPWKHLASPNRPTARFTFERAYFSAEKADCQCRIPSRRDRNSVLDDKPGARLELQFIGYRSKRDSGPAEPSQRQARFASIGMISSVKQ